MRLLKNRTGETILYGNGDLTPDGRAVSMNRGRSAGLKTLRNRR